MLLVSVRSRSVSVGAASEVYNEPAHGFDCGDICISIRAGPLFGFRCKVGD